MQGEWAQAGTQLSLSPFGVWVRPRIRHSHSGSISHAAFCRWLLCARWTSQLKRALKQTPKSRCAVHFGVNILHHGGFKRNKQVVEKYWIEPYGDRRQEIVFIGSRTMQQKRITDALDGALLTDAELKRGPAAWSKFEDPIAVLSDDDVMEFLEVDEDEDGEESGSDDSAEVAPAKRSRNSSKSKPHDHSICIANAKATKQAKIPAAAVAGVRRSSRRA